jgi:hypothetical protein
MSEARDERTWLAFEVDPGELGKHRRDALQIHCRVVAVVEHQLELWLFRKPDLHVQCLGGRTVANDARQASLS